MCLHFLALQHCRITSLSTYLFWNEPNPTSTDAQKVCRTRTKQNPQTQRTGTESVLWCWSLSVSDHVPSFRHNLHKMQGALLISLLTDTVWDATVALYMKARSGTRSVAPISICTVTVGLSGSGLIKRLQVQKGRKIHTNIWPFKHKRHNREGGKYR